MTPILRAAATVPVLLGLLWAPFAYAEFQVPPNDGYVTDATGLPEPLISPAQDAALEAILADYEARTTNQIIVLVIRSLGNEDLEQTATQIFRDYGVGTKQNDNGILVLVSYDDRAVRLEVGYGLEGAVPDIVAKGIIDTDMIPRFRDADYAGGIAAAVDSLQKHIGNEYTAERYSQESGDMEAGGFGLFIGFILLQWILSILARTKSWWLGGVFGFFGGVILAITFGWWLSIPLLVLLGLLLDFVVSKNYHARGPNSWWAGGNWGPGGGGRWGGGGGGGFGGFGGGSSGGGGASGRW